VFRDIKITAVAVPNFSVNLLEAAANISDTGSGMEFLQRYNAIYNARIEQAVTAVMIQTRIQEELGSNLDLDTCYPEIFSCFLQSPQTNVKIKPLSLPYKLFQIHQSPYHSSVYIIYLSMALQFFWTLAEF
jgi:hypothetical protein